MFLPCLPRRIAACARRDDERHEKHRLSLQTVQKEVHANGANT